MKTKNGDIKCSKCWDVYCDEHKTNNKLIYICGQCKRFYSESGRLLKSYKFDKNGDITKK